MDEGEEADTASCSPNCPAVKPVRPGPLLITPGPLIGYGNLRELALPPNALDPGTKFNDLYVKLAPVKCAGIVLNDMIPGDEPDWARWDLSADGYWRPLFGLWTCENAFGRSHMQALSAVMGDLRSDGVRLPFETGMSPVTSREVTARIVFALRLRIERLLADAFGWVRRFDPMAGWRMWMRHRLFYAPSRFYIPNGCTTTVNISVGSTGWSRFRDYLSQDYTLIFCLHRSYRFHYRLPDASEYCVLLQPGTVIGFLGGVFEHKLDLVPRAESGEAFPDDEAYVFTCYTSQKLFGDGGVYPRPLPDMHIHKVPGREDRAPEVAPVAGGVDKGWPRARTSGGFRRESPEPVPVDVHVEPRSSKRLKTAHRRQQSDESTPWLSPQTQQANSVAEWKLRVHDGEGKRWFREACDYFHHAALGAPVVASETAALRPVTELDPLCWPKYSILHIPKAFGHRTAAPLMQAMKQMTEYPVHSHPTVSCTSLVPLNRGVQRGLDGLRRAMSELLKHTIFSLCYADSRTTHRMRHRHMHYYPDEVERDLKIEWGYGKEVVTSFTVSRGESAAWTRGDDHLPQDYTLIFSPAREGKLYLRPIDARGAVGHVDVFDLSPGNVVGFLADVYEYKVELQEPEAADAFVFTCFTSRAVCAAEGSSAASLPPVNDVVAYAAVQKEFRNTKQLWSSEARRAWWR